jgi:hypothetical protein
VRGQSTGAVLHEHADDEVHTKLVYVASLAGRRDLTSLRGGEHT